jgi:hypothetical protein
VKLSKNGGGDQIAQQPSGQAVCARRVVTVARQMVRETPAATAAGLAATKTRTEINTAAMKRPNGRVRSVPAALGSCLRTHRGSVAARMWLVGCTYDFY